MTTATEELAESLDELRYALNAAKPATVALAALLRRRPDLNDNAEIRAHFTNLAEGARRMAGLLIEQSQGTRKVAESIKGIPA